MKEKLLSVQEKRTLKVICQQTFFTIAYELIFTIVYELSGCGFESSCYRSYNL